jgi:hypothetical protein
METSPTNEMLNRFEEDEPNNVSYQLTSPKANKYDFTDNQSMYI